MQVRQHLGVGGSIIEDHEDLEREALRGAILLQLLDKLSLALGPENMAHHPTTGVGEPVDRQASLIIVLKGMRVLDVVDKDGLQHAVSCQVSPQQEGETVLKCLETWGDFSSFMMYVRSGIFFHCRPVSSILNTCWGL